MHVLGNFILQSLSVLMMFTRAEEHRNRVSSADLWNLMLLFLIFLRLLAEESFICAEDFSLALDLCGPCRLEFIRSAQNNAVMATDRHIRSVLTCLASPGADPSDFAAQLAWDRHGHNKTQVHDLTMLTLQRKELCFSGVLLLP